MGLIGTFWDHFWFFSLTRWLFQLGHHIDFITRNACNGFYKSMIDFLYSIRYSHCFTTSLENQLVMINQVENTGH